jgi:hypothetical protein
MEVVTPLRWTDHGKERDVFVTATLPLDNERNCPLTIAVIRTPGKVAMKKKVEEREKRAKYRR